MTFFITVIEFLNSYKINICESQRAALFSWCKSSNYSRNSGSFSAEKMHFRGVYLTVIKKKEAENGINGAFSAL
jgi:hypothetical protein